MIGLTRPAVDEAIDRIDTALTDMEQELGRLAGRVGALEARWDGEAKTAFAIAMADCRSQLVELRRVGAALNEVARRSVDRIDHLDRLRAEAWVR